MKLMEHLTAVRGELLNRRDGIDRTLEALDLVEKGLRVSDRTEGASELMEPEEKQRLDAQLAAHNEEVRRRAAFPAGEAEPIGLMAAIREIAEAQVAFSAADMKKTIETMHPHLESRNVTAALCSLVKSGELKSKGKGRERIYQYKAKRAKGPGKAKKNKAAKRTKAKPAPAPREKPKLAVLIRKYAEEVQGGKDFTREQIEDWMAKEYPEQDTKHISARLGNLAARGELLAKGVGRARAFCWNPQGTKGKPEQGETLRGQIASGCEEAKAEKPDRATQERQQKPGITMEEAMLEAGKLLQHFTRAQLEDYLEKHLPGLIPQELKKDKSIIGATISKLVDKGRFARTREANFAQGILATYSFDH